MNEAETRAEHIDPALAAVGWGVVEGSKILREFPITPGRIEGLASRRSSECGSGSVPCCSGDVVSGLALSHSQEHEGGFIRTIIHNEARA
jgi:hypothetical protein